MDIAFFGDFSNPSLRAEIGNIRQVSNTIIDTQNATDKIIKDFTDFIILDHIYQSAMNGNADAYIIFTGDGHFSSAASFLVTKCRKEVGIYAVRQAASAQLIGCATYSRLIPDDEKSEPVKKDLAAEILGNLRKLYDKQTKKKKVYPTFWATVETVVRQKHVPREEAAKTLRSLISSGYVYQTKEVIGKQKDQVKVLRVDWDKVKKDRMM